MNPPDCGDAVKMRPRALKFFDRPSDTPFMSKGSVLTGRPRWSLT